MEEHRGSRLEVMNFLNEMAGKYPAAVSFASGRPAEVLFALNGWNAWTMGFVDHMAQQRGISAEQAQRELAQYGPTGGIVNGLISRQLNADDALGCRTEDIVVTAGCQEAIELCVRHLCKHPDDIVLACSPTYIGITGVADLHGVGLWPLSSEEGGSLADALASNISACRAAGKQPRAFYVVSDFDNPTGAVLSLAGRLALIDLCAREGIMILEDNPYRMFRYEGAPIPTLYELDRYGCVTYLGTYSKTLFPAVRVGFAVVPRYGAASSRAMVASLTQAKSFVTVNTSQLNQALVGGFLLEQQFSLREHLRPALAYYSSNRNCMLDALARAFAGLHSEVSWNRPEGGFFLIVTLPFPFRHAQAQRCADDYGVLVMPLCFFAHDERSDNAVRFAFSNATHAQINEGVARFARFVRDQLST